MDIKERINERYKLEGYERELIICPFDISEGEDVLYYKDKYGFLVVIIFYEKKYIIELTRYLIGTNVGYDFKFDSLVYKLSREYGLENYNEIGFWRL